MFRPPRMLLNGLIRLIFWLQNNFSDRFLELFRKWSLRKMRPVPWWPPLERPSQNDKLDFEVQKFGTISSKKSRQLTIFLSRGHLRKNVNDFCRHRRRAVVFLKTFLQPNRSHFVIGNNRKKSNVLSSFSSDSLEGLNSKFWLLPHTNTYALDKQTENQFDKRNDRMVRWVWKGLNDQPPFRPARQRSHLTAHDRSPNEPVAALSNKESLIKCL